ncbi:hypothetical protein FA95DRAFT_1603957 [Auriscalpium vulgare]|uniref:Uncharacterized protein n=1 Tax=Auriscalpium vulgare TaxID=40419 RepID=A0ACB8S1E9_9AGAM|nr:hypothetical protein FA95DRAFT_1603957 [Auriscalpium vulgare]
MADEFDRRGEDDCGGKETLQVTSDVVKNGSSAYYEETAIVQCFSHIGWYPPAPANTPHH